MTSIEAHRDYLGCGVLVADDYLGLDESSEEPSAEDHSGVDESSVDAYFASDEPADERPIAVFVSYAAGERCYSVPLVGSRYLDHAPATYSIRIPSLRAEPEEPSRADTDVRAEFERLKEQWEEKSEYMSVLTDMVLLQEYQEIIGLGRPAVPLIIDELRKGGDHWFWALAAIAREDHAAGAKNFEEAAARWINWYESSSND